MGGVLARSEECMGEMEILIRHAAKCLNMDRPPVAALSFLQIKAKGKPPKLKVKAAEARGMLEVVSYMLQYIFPPTTDHTRLRLNMLLHLRDMYRVLKEWVKDPTVNRASNVADLGRKHCILYAELSKESFANSPGDFVFWRLYPKHHMFIHCICDQMAESGNPAENWCYMDEDKIGEGAKRADILHPNTLHRSLIDRWRHDI